MRYCFDIDGTICDTPLTKDDKKPGYLHSTPIPLMIEEINRLYDEGNYIILMTARGRGSGLDWTELTKTQLKDWGLKYHELEPMFHKPHADIFIDDKGIDVEVWKRQINGKRGIVAGAFDIIHPGYIRMFKEAKKYCSHLTVAIHTDPSTERPHKLKPVQDVYERGEILYSIKYIDECVFYNTENEFHNILKSKSYDMRFVGEDYKDGSYTGKDIDIDVVFLNRKHKYSTTKLKKEIVSSWRSYES